MCGICGIWSPDPAARAPLGAMAAVLRHRGPDDDGFYTDPREMGLGFRRLSIIDLAGGHQPLSNEDGTVWIAFNGEVYNFPELRAGLLQRGHRFATRSDTETVVHLYEERGRDCVDSLRGMFAFAIWDTRRESLLLARDRLGVKPLYYIQLPGLFLFASEIKALLQHPAVPRGLNLAALDDLLALRFVPGPDTLFAGIHKLPPGCTLELRDGAPVIHRYWDLDRPEAAPRRSAAEYEEELLEQLREAVRIRLISDVPLGAFLSGGVDSSAVVALMSQLSSSPVKTFSIGFAQPEYDERPYARQVARHLGTAHTEQVVEPASARDLLPELVWHFDEPFGDSSALPTYFVAQMARRHVTVVLTGDGGDEAFAGYTMFQGERFAQIYGRQPALLRRLAAATLAEARAVAPAAGRARLARAHRVLAQSAGTPLDRFYHKTLCFDDRLRARLYRPEVAAHLTGGPLARLQVLAAPGLNRPPLDQIAYLTGRIALPDDMLVKVDRMTMAHGLEARGPFLDHRLVEFAARLPMDLKLRGFTGKYLLKKAVAPLLPAGLLNRRKHGFAVPLGAWFGGDLRAFAREILLAPDSRALRYFRQPVIARLLAPPTPGAPDYAEQIWILLNFEVWHRMFLDNEFDRLPTPAAHSGPPVEAR